MKFKVKYEEDKNLVVKAKVEKKGNDVIVHLPTLGVLAEVNKLKKEKKIK